MVRNLSIFLVLAAILALPPARLRLFVAEVCARKHGPPFSVDEAEVRELFAPQWQVELLERRDILAQEPGFRAEGVSALSTAVYRLQRLP